jgi:predicted DNA-binding WGR domain protein
MKTIKLAQELYLEIWDAAHSKFYTIAIQAMAGDGGYLLLTRRGRLNCKQVIVVEQYPDLPSVSARAHELLGSKLKKGYEERSQPSNQQMSLPIEDLKQVLNGLTVGTI